MNAWCSVTQLTTFDESKPLNRAEGRIEHCGYSGGGKKMIFEEDEEWEEGEDEEWEEEEW